MPILDTIFLVLVAGVTLGLLLDHYNRTPQPAQSNIERPDPLCAPSRRQPLTAMHSREYEDSVVYDLPTGASEAPTRYGALPVSHDIEPVVVEEKDRFAWLELR